MALLRTFRQVADQASEQRRTFNWHRGAGNCGHPGTSLKRYPHRIDLPDAITLDSYPGPLGQVVINLVNNAYLHAFEGRSNGVLAIAASASGDRVLLTVADNGVGMSSEAQKHLFQPFLHQAQRGGTGLGMSIVSNLVTKTLGGTIGVNSTEGSGTTWSIDLPQVAPGGKA
ncbi:MAG: ATP-binding protein [Burkholderiales bacterium]|nr:ATP-binding protein [Burkholderiales bacterium]